MPIPSEVSEVNVLLNLYESVPQELGAAVEGLDNRQLSRTPEPAWGAGAWTARQVVQHVADADLVFDHRLRRTIAEDEPSLALWDENQFAARLGYDKADVSLALSLIDLTHRRTLPLLRELTAEQWQRGALHPERGQMTVHMILHYAAHHGRHHAEILARKRDFLLRP